MKLQTLAVALSVCWLAAAAAPPSGPEVGKQIPSFSLPDQNGRMQTLDSLAGRNGLVLAFVRSADW